MNPILSIENLSFKYRRKEDFSLKDLSLNIECGEIILIAGASGAGKSTFCSLLNGIIPHLLRGAIDGEVLIKGKSTRNEQVSDLSQTVGYVFQDFDAQLFSTNIFLEVAFGLENISLSPGKIKDRVDDALKTVHMERYLNRDPGSLSGGQKQRLAIASVLAMKPEIICFDEPATDLDPLGKKEVYDIIKTLSSRDNTTSIIVDHEIEEMSYVDKVLVLKKGEVVFWGKSLDIVLNSRMLESNGIKPLDLPDLFSRLKIEINNPFISTSEAFKLFQEKGYTLSREKKRSLCKLEGERKGRYGSLCIDIKGLAFSYEEEDYILKDINMEIKEGEFVAILGQNGSGKTTLIKHLNGLLRPRRGNVIVHGNNTRDTPLNILGSIIGFVFQNPDHQIFCETVREELLFTLKLRDITQDEIAGSVYEAARAVGLEGLLDADPYSLGKGDRQKVAVASVLASRPKIIVLDEPTTGLDYLEIKSMMRLLKKLNKAGYTIIMVTHAIWFAAESAHRLIVMKDGDIVADGDTRDILSNNNVLESTSIISPKILQLGLKMGFPTLTIKEFIDLLGDLKL